MLSRIIGREKATNEGVQLFAPTPLSRHEAGSTAWGNPASPAPDSALSEHLARENTRLAAENLSLIGRLAALEAELTAAKSEAFSTGVRQGEQRAQQEIAPVVERMNQAILDTVTTRQESRRRAERDVVQLALMIARRVLHREIATDPGALNALARVVFERMARSDSYTLTIHPGFVEGVRSVLSGAQIAQVRIDADPSCGPGTFIIRSPEGSMDASIEAQLDEISHGLADRLAEQ